MCTIDYSPAILTMRRYLLLLPVIFLMLLKSTDCRANHIFGGDLLYTNIVNDSTYVIKLTLYGDCGSTTPLTSLVNGRPRVVFFNGGTFVDTLRLSLLPGSGIEVSPVCPAQASQTACNGGTLPGVRQFIYTDTIKTGLRSSSLKFIFQGDLYSVAQAGRSSHITNIVGGGAISLIQLEADLNNTNGPNSSPEYSTIPTPFYCINFSQQYNQGAADPNGDSLSFSLVSATDARTNSPVSYVYPFTPTYPLSTTTGGFYFNPINGQMTFTPNNTQEGLVVCKVTEYKNGVMTGNSEREMVFIVQDNCNGSAPIPNITALVGATVTNGTVINICKSNPHVSFDIDLSNPDGDTTFITASNVPPSASLTINNNGTPNAGISFNWNTDTLSIGTYSFYLSIKSNHCPIFFAQTVAYTINVANPPTITDTQLSFTQCIYPAAMQFHLTQGFIPRTVTITQGGVVVKTIIDSTGSVLSGVVTDSLPVGNYTATVSSDALCTASVSFSISDSGSLPHVDADTSLCRLANTSPINITPVNPSATIVWYNTSGVPLLGAPLPNTYTTGSYTWYFIETYRSCSTGPDTVHVTVNNLPVAKILNIPTTVCYGDDIYLRATGGVSYTWQPENEVQTDTGGLYVHILSPLTVTVNATDANGCSDTASVTYADIQPCCNFSYPTAFTPNGDGNNDGFKIVTYGNMLHYALSIYNRWGQRVFWTGDPDRRWDGNLNGKPCEAGVYYYTMEGQCLTGQKQQHRGDVTLVR